MEVRSIKSFLDYFEKVRQRTMRVVERIPADKLEWTYQSGRFTAAELARHIAAVERWTFAENIAGRPNAYSGCGRELADGRDAVLAFMRALHAESLAIFAALSDADLAKPVTTAAGPQVSTSAWLRAMIEHEIHHRGQLYVYLSLMGVEGPPLFGVTEKQLAAHGTTTK